jgi:predicted DNA-binding transcriptional regulator AlpA
MNESNMIVANPSPILDAQGLADLFGVSRDTIDRRRSQLPPAFMVGKRRLWHRDVVIEHVRRSNLQMGNGSAA